MTFTPSGGSPSGKATNSVLDEIQGLREDFRNLLDITAMAIKTASTYTH